MIGNDWDIILKDIFESNEFKNLYDSIKKEYDSFTCFPLFENIFNAFKLTPYDKVKVVILGQDPYHEVGQAHGLSFSVPEGTKMPPSLRNIFKEMNDDIGVINTKTDLSKWAKEGVFLLNSILSVREGEALSHEKYGWEWFTDSVISKLNKKDDPIVFVFWGANAKKKKKLITSSQHLVIESAHPSPLSAYNGFFGSKPFSQINKFLTKNNKKEIDFKL